MTDINEIIGRAMLDLLGLKGEGDCNGDAFFADIGPAVVKALGEAGYQIMSKEDIAAIEFQSAQHLGG